MFAGKRGLTWMLLARWLVPAMMTLAYIFMALTAETDTTGQAWMALGLAFVMMLWWIFRMLTGSAALAHAIGVGDADRILDIAGRELAGRRRNRAKLLAARAFAFEVRGAWQDALVATDAAATAIGEELSGATRTTLAAKVAAVRIAALVELGRADEARTVLAGALAPARVRSGPASAASRLAGIELDAIVELAEGRIAAATGDTASAATHLDHVITDVRAGSFQRAGAHHYAAKLASARGDTAAATRHAAAAAKLAPHSWLARQASPSPR
jgi:hypothetical protein